MALLSLAEKDSLLRRAKVIRDEVMKNANTANRVGSLFFDIIAFLGSMDVDELSQFFLRKDKDDTAEGTVTFLKEMFAKNGIEIGDFIDSFFNGRGAAIDANGNAQLQSLEVRTYLKVMELIINRVQAQEGEFTFTESGMIEDVQFVANDTYLLRLRKRWDADFHAFQEGDVVYGAQNSLLMDGSILHSWFRVLETDLADNTITVLMYPDDEVPEGKNSVPVPSMAIARRGNAINEERQACWYLSSYEGVIMYLEGVTKPILDESNYYLSLGKPKHLSLFENLPINYGHPYLFARGAIIQDLLRVDFKGNPVYEVIDMGIWDAKETYIKGYSEELQRYVQHQVWFDSVCWRCIVDKTTPYMAPRWNSTEWIAISGNYRVGLDTIDGQHWFRGTNVYTTFVAKVYHGDADISDDITDSQVEWSRLSGQPAEDVEWNIRHASAGLNLEITPADLPTDFYKTRQVSFKVKVSVRPGEEASANFFIKL